MKSRQSLKKNAAAREALGAVSGGKEARLTIGQVSQMLGVSTSTLRLWENVGLCIPERSQSGYRLYGPETLAVLKRIKHLRKVEHLNVHAIKRVLDEGDRGEPTHPKNVGLSLELMRHRQGLSLTAAAKRAGLTAGYLSAIEKSQSKAPYRAIQKLAKIYGTSVLGLHHLPEKTSHLVRSGTSNLISFLPGFQLELLSVGARSMESMVFRIEPGAGCSESFAHNGEEFIFALEGKFEICLDEEETFEIAAGDSIWYESSRPHRWRNPSQKEKAIVLWIVVSSSSG